MDNEENARIKSRLSTKFDMVISKHYETWIHTSTRVGWVVTHTRERLCHARGTGIEERVPETRENRFFTVGNLSWAFQKNVENAYIRVWAGCYLHTRMRRCRTRGMKMKMRRGLSSSEMSDIVINWRSRKFDMTISKKSWIRLHTRAGWVVTRTNAWDGAIREGRILKEERVVGCKCVVWHGIFKGSIHTLIRGRAGFGLTRARETAIESTEKHQLGVRRFNSQENDTAKS